MYSVIYETAYKTVILFSGSLAQCKEFRSQNAEFCGDEAFIQEMDEDYNELLTA